MNYSIYCLVDGFLLATKRASLVFSVLTQIP